MLLYVLQGKITYPIKINQEKQNSPQNARAAADIIFLMLFFS